MQIFLSRRGHASIGGLAKWMLYDKQKATRVILLEMVPLNVRVYANIIILEIIGRGREGGGGEGNKEALIN